VGNWYAESPLRAPPLTQASVGSLPHQVGRISGVPAAGIHDSTASSPRPDAADGRPAADGSACGRVGPDSGISGRDPRAAGNLGQETGAADTVCPVPSPHKVFKVAAPARDPPAYRTTSCPKQPRSTAHPIQPAPTPATLAPPVPQQARLREARSRTVLRALRTKTVRVYPYASHAINGEYAEELAADLDTFLTANS
jgi:hypothetical protein